MATKEYRNYRLYRGASAVSGWMTRPKAMALIGKSLPNYPAGARLTVRDRAERICSEAIANGKNL